MAQEIRCSRTEDQKPAGACPFVDQTAQDREQVGHALDLVQHDQPVGERAQEKFRFDEFRGIGGPLEVEKHRTGLRRRDPPGEGGLADLPCAEQRNAGELSQGGEDFRFKITLNHPRILKGIVLICKDSVSCREHCFREHGGVLFATRVQVSAADFPTHYRRAISFKYLANLVRTEESISR